MKENLKKILGIIVILFLFLLIIFYAYKINSNTSSKYISSSDQILMQNQAENNSNQSVSATGIVQEGTPFESRNISGGGEKPGWLVSVSETQPKVFTGKFFTKEGVEAYDLFMQEENGFLAGEAKNTKSPNDIQALTIQKTDEVCLDLEKNSFEYKLSANFKGESLNGCGGKATAK